MKDDSGNAAMDGLFPFLGTVLFGKCPMMNVTKVIETREKDDDSFRAPSKKVPSQVEVRTCGAYTTDPSLQGGKSDQILKAYRAEDCEETTLSPSLLLKGELADCDHDACEDSKHEIALKEQNLCDGSRTDDATPQTISVTQENCSSFQSTTPTEGPTSLEDPHADNTTKPTPKREKSKRRVRLILSDDFGENQRRSLLRTASFSTRLSQGATSKSVKSSASRAATIVSASKSVKSLPREIELEEINETIDEEESESQTNDTARRGSGKAKVPHLIQVTQQVWTDYDGVQGIYAGSFAQSSNQPHGFGRFQHWGTGEWYEGEFRHGEKSGQGRKLSANGDFYEGAFKSLEHGFGIKKFKDGRVFKGQFMLGQMMQGEMRYEDGSTYSGEWMDGMKHGRGNCVFSDNSLYVGQFRYGKIAGYGKMLWMDGGYYEGEWEQGEMHGYGKEVLPNGNLRHEGQWAEGLPVRSSA
mmetsp:Transcript_24794/g.68628  ORF Transcript_24794/g.68628 Transcript_24794/m.68628 type:complete len:470 (+) Transcript_24794:183-1592(+)